MTNAKRILIFFCSMIIASALKAEPSGETGTVVPNKASPAGRVIMCEGFHRANIKNTTPWRMIFYVKYGINPPGGDPHWVVVCEVVLNPGESFGRVFHSELPCVGMIKGTKAIEGFTEIWYYGRRTAESRMTGTLFVT